jgi:hypothetical protein
MTTSFITKCVSPDLIITTPAQITEAFKVWYDKIDANPEAFQASGDNQCDSKTSTIMLLTILTELNQKGR